jgi:hypothetical protein
MKLRPGLLPTTVTLNSAIARKMPMIEWLSTPEHVTHDYRIRPQKQREGRRRGSATFFGRRTDDVQLGFSRGECTAAMRAVLVKTGGGPLRRSSCRRYKGPAQLSHWRKMRTFWAMSLLRFAPVCDGSCFQLVGIKVFWCCGPRF